jgi:pyridoxal phosphate enzyme (YggS family)
METRLIQVTLQANLAAVQRRLASACARVGRSSKEVTLVAVTKTVTAEVAACLPALGIFDLGESRPQELARKAAQLPGSIRWHLIGHLQRNKIDRTLPLVHCVHSVDNLRLLEAVDREAGKQGRPLPVLLEVNASAEHSKHGLAPAEVVPLAPRLRQLQQLQVKGLMTMAALQEPEQCRPTFALLRELRDQLRRELGPPHTMERLSMGMSNDFEVAVEEGATFVRLGSVLFENLPENHE